MGSVYEGYWGDREPVRGDKDYTQAASASMEPGSDPNFVYPPDPDSKYESFKGFKDRLYYGFGDRFRNERAKLTTVCVKRAALKGMISIIIFYNSWALLP